MQCRGMLRSWLHNEEDSLLFVLLWFCACSADVKGSAELLLIGFVHVLQTVTFCTSEER